MGKPHVHAELIKAWADGAMIEVYARDTGKWVIATPPSWNYSSKYRVKPREFPKSTLEYGDLCGFISAAHEARNKGSN